MALQRHVNLLKDPSKVKRRRAIQHISRKIEELCDEAEEKKGPALVVQKLFLESLAPNVTACLKDESEKPREISVGLCRMVLPFLDLEKSKNGGLVFKSFIKPIHHQIGTHPTLEPSEEVRLAMLELTIDMLEYAPRYAVDNLDDLMAISTNSCKDAFPKVKVKVGVLIERIASLVLLRLTDLPASSITQLAGQLAKALASNLKHQRFRVRAAALRGISAVVEARGCVEQWFREAFNVLATMTMDRTPSVRVLLAQRVARWLVCLKLERSDRSKLLLVLISLVGDDDPSCREAAIQGLTEIGNSKEIMEAMRAERKLDSGSDGGGGGSSINKDGDEKNESSSSSSSSGKGTWRADVISGPFKEPPSKETCAAVRICVQELIQPVLKQMEAWTNDERCQAASTLHTLIILGQDAVVTSESLPRVLQALMKHVSDLEDPSYPKVCQTLRTIGCLLPVGSWIEHTLRSLQTNAEGGHSAWLVLLNEMVKGTPKGSLFPYMLKLSRVLSRCSIALSEDRPTRFFARAAMTSLLLHYDNNNSSAAGGGVAAPTAAVRDKASCLCRSCFGGLFSCTQRRRVGKSTQPWRR